MTTNRLLNLTENKRRLLELLRTQRGKKAPAPEVVVSYGQERLWFLEQLEPDRAPYIITTAIRLRGTLDRSALQRSLLEVVRRHEVVRTALVNNDGLPSGVLSDVPEFELPEVDLEGCDRPEWDETLRREFRAEAHRRFDLGTAPLLRAKLLRFSEREHVLLLSMHHIVSDGWSMRVLTKEVSAFYDAFSNGRSCPLRPLAHQYADYTKWQREWLQGRELKRQLEYWTAKLAGAPSSLDLPRDRPRPRVPRHSGQRCEFTVDERLTAGLRAFSRQESATVFMVLVATFKLLLSRYAGQRTIVLGTPIANRLRADHAPLLGFFVNTLVLRTDLPLNWTFRELLASVRETCLEAYAHPDLPFERLVEELHPQRDLSRNPLFDVAFLFQQPPTLSLESLEATQLDLDSGVAQFDLTLTVTDRSKDLAAAFDYDEDLFDADTIAQMSTHYGALLREAIARPETNIWRIPILGGADAPAWNGARVAFSEDACLHDLVTHRASLQPDGTAIEYEGHVLTYSELHRRSNQLARRLISSNVLPGQCVAVCMHRSLETVIAILAVLKAGGAYLALDPNLPPERLAFICSDAEVALVLAQARTASLVEACTDAPYLVVDTACDVNDESSEDIDPRCPPDAIAYVIYTSGSTGTPKGVLGSHRGLVNRLEWMAGHYPVGSQDVCVQKTTLGFVDSLTETFGALIAGVPLTILPEEAAKDPASLMTALSERGVTRLVVVPSLLQAVLEQDGALSERLAALSLCITSGEALSADLAARFQQRLPRARLVNLYGSSEVAGDATYYEVPRQLEGAKPSVSIGRPIANISVHILDREFAVSPRRVLGELYVGGLGLADGYLRRPDLTAERFVPDAFDRARPGARIYRTGDVARIRADGHLEYAGRVDHQVKLRGFRIELGEIEAVLGQHPGVRKCTVVAREDTPGSPRLVAYVEQKPDCPSAEALRQLLKARLPDYMIPSAVVVMAELPLTSSGKIDRRALPTPERTSTTYVAPRNALEQTLTEIWAEVLRVPQVGVYDDFFELGGHSLLATKVIARVSRVLTVQLPLRRVFEATTIAALADAISAIESEGAAQLPPIARRPADVPQVLSFGQERLWFLDQLEQGNSPAYNIAGAVRLSGRLVADALRATLKELVRRHEILRTTYATVDGRAHAVVEEPIDFDVPLEDLAGLDRERLDETVRERAYDEAHRPFDLGRGPVLRARLLRLAPEEHVLLFTVHHIASDGWSMGVIVRELVAVYAAYTSGKPSALQPLPVQYSDYAYWQRERLRPLFEEQLTYWRERLEGAPPALDLPTDKRRPETPTSAGATFRFELPEALTAAVNTFSRARGVTPFMTLLAAFQALLARYAAQSEVLVGTPVANRAQPQTEGLVGFFVNTLVLRTDLSGSPSFSDLVGRVRDVCLGAYAHQDVPFDKVVDAVRPVRDLGRTPLFQVMFSFDDALDLDVSGGALTASPMDIEFGVAQFDLTLAVTRRGDRLTAALDYSTALFERATIAAFAGRFTRLLTTALARPELPIADHSLLGDGEERRVLVEWNDTSLPFPDSGVPTLFEERATAHGDRIAIVRDDGALTYREVDEHSNALAIALLRQGAKRGDRVAVLLEPSLESFWCFLGIAKAGCSYVPLDPQYPDDRLDFILSDSGARVLVTGRRHADRLASPTTSIVVDGLTAVATADGLHASYANADDEAYVIYTSGSTGVPKGVAVNHRALANHNAWMKSALGFGDTDRVLQLASPGFDVWFGETLSAVLSGGTLVLVGGMGAQDTARVLATTIEQQATSISVVPSQLRAMTEEPAFVECRSLRRILCGSEAMPSDLLGKVMRVIPAKLYNAYGPTETAIDATITQCSAEESGAEYVDIGRAISNKRTYLLDDAFAPVAPGVPGQLYVGGEGIAWGYLGQTRLTAERFVPDPFSATRGTRMYRTGDRARWLPNGKLDFLGRIDDQIKIRGFRIELGEIEAILREHLKVKDCIVASFRRGAGDPRLAAYVVVRDAPIGDGGDADGVGPHDHRFESLAAELRAYLGKSLPDYMVPSAFVPLDRLPVTPNGKLDRKALPPPTWDHAGATYEPPRGPVESALTAIFEDVLGIPRVGAADNFFELGGHSLMATQLVSRLRRAIGVELPLRVLFEAPTVRELAERVASTSGAGIQSRIERRARSGKPPPLSFAQERLWFLMQLEPQSTAYNMAAAVRAVGRLDVQLLERAFDELLRRHESLRTTFRLERGEPVQVVHEPTPFVLERRSARAQDVFEQAEREARRPFDLERGPLFRAQLLEIGAEEGVLLLAMHHIISDGWSIGIMEREIAAIYSALSQDRPSPLPELAIQYADYAAWQREWLTEERLEQHLAYWRRQLADAPAALELPTDHPRPTLQTSRGAALSFEVSPTCTGALRALTHANDATLFMTLLTAFAVLLSRSAHQDDVVIGTPIANRTSAELEDIFGLFVNTLALRVDLSGEPTFRQLLARVREVTLAAYAHQDAPFERVVSELRLERNLTRSPVFQVMLALQNVPSAGIDLAGVTLSSLRVPYGGAQFDLTLDVTEVGDGLECTLEYSSDLFDRETVERMATQLGLLLEGAARNPDCPVTDLPLLDRRQRQQLVLDWNATSRPEIDTDLCIHELIERQVDATPDAVAVVFEGAQLTYRELDRRANAFARTLRRHGVGPDVPVAVCVQRSLEVAIALFAVLKAGGAFVPVDPEYPPARIAYMLRDASPRVVVTDSTSEKQLAACGAPIVRIDRESDETCDARIASGASTANLAYAIYTSGTTGQPKGVTIPHAAIANVLRWMQSAFNLTNEDAVLQKTSLSFDTAMEEILWPLLSGARLVVPQPGGHRDVRYLAKVIANESVTAMDFVPSMLAPMVDELAACRTLRVVFAGGEALSTDLRERVLANSGAELCNLYGPTEAAIQVLSWMCDRADTRAPVPIGRPIANTQAYALDRKMNPVPIGVAGELWVGGAQLARGYHRRAALTAERFVPHPFAAGERIYRTGDLARVCADGVIEYFGRADEQVKLRGFRIELGEIEAALATHPAVRMVAVTARKDRRDDTRLVAYWVGDDADSGVLRAHLQKTLPDYMVPSAFVRLSAFPTTPNGKVDRKALPAPESLNGPASSYTGAVTSGQDIVAPRTPTEDLVAGAFAGVLGVARVSVRDSFFELGGHSLLATQLVNRVRKDLGVDVPLRAVFEHPTVEALAAFVGQSKAESGAPIVRVDRSQPLPLSFAQQRLWFIDQLEPGSSAYNVPSAVRLEGALDVAALERALNEVVARQEALRTVFRMVNDHPEQVIVPSLTLSLAVEPVTEEAAREVVEEEAIRPFDLAQGPVVRVRLLRLRDDVHVLVVVMHHIVSDAWSTGVFIREVAALYDAFSNGELSPLPELSVQYADFAAWQRAQLVDERLETQLSYWKEQLAGAPPLLELPTDRPRPAVATYRGGWVPIHVDAALTERLRTLARERGATLFMVLLAAFQALLHRYTGANDIVVGTPIANRSRAEVEALIGFFLNTLALRADLSHDPSFSALVAQVRERSLGAYAHQDLPFERLVEELRVPRSLSYEPVFQAMFVLEAAAVPTELGGLRITALNAEHTTAKFDLLLSLSETRDGLEGGTEYASDLFDAATIDRLNENFRTLLEAIASNPDAPLSTLALLSNGERRLLAHWNDTSVAGQGDACVHRFFEAQTDATPDAVAVQQGDHQLTYAQLDRHANRLARRLRQRGVVGGAVGIVADRSIEMIVAVLGTLKAGAACVPLDLSYPTERLAFVVGDTRAPIVLTSARAAERLPTFEGATFERFVIDLGVETVDSEDPGRNASAVFPDSLAYVIYTSGSTGRPKGVALSHRALTNLVMWQTRSLPLCARSRVLQFASLAFDVSFQELFTTWAAGATLVLVEEDMRADFSQLLLAMKRDATNRLFVPFVALEHLAAAALAQGGLPTSLTEVITAGEQLRVEPPLVACFGSSPTCRLHNHYGPSESHVVTAYTLDEDPSSWPALPSIGGPIDNAHVHVVDASLNQVPVGVAGELLIGGSCVARGYFDRPDLTAERFIPDPSGNLGDRAYRTGDLTRWTPQGRLEFLGRIDHQVKIRGFRVELGEIEAQLATHPSVRMVAVVAREDHLGEKRLAAYWVGDDADGGVFRAHLKKTLPDYMVPSAFVRLDAFPMTPNGKVDRKALPAPDSLSVPASARTEPRDVTELVVQRILERVLAVRVGITDDFFDLGGHSLHAVRVCAELERSFGRPVPVSSLFVHRSVESIATILRDTMHTRAPSPIVTLGKSAPNATSLIVAHPAGGELHCYADLVRHFGAEVSGLQWSDGLPTAGASTLKDIGRRYAKHIEATLGRGPHVLLGWSVGGLIAFETARELAALGVAVRHLFLLDTYIANGTSANAELDGPSLFSQLLTTFAHILCAGAGAENVMTELIGSGVIDEGFEAVVSLLEARGVLPPGLGPEHLRRPFEVFGTIMAITETYTPEPYSGDLTLIQPDGADSQEAQDARERWRGVVTGRFESCTTPGDHFSMLREPGANAIATILRHTLRDERI